MHRQERSRRLGSGGSIAAIGVALAALSGGGHAAEACRPFVLSEPALTIGDRARRPASGAVLDDVLAAEAIAPLTAGLSPTAVTSPSGRALAYHTWQELRSIDPTRSHARQGIRVGDALGRPALRLKDLVSGADRVLVEGASSVAWSGDGRIAFVQGAELRAGVAWTGQIAVQRKAAERPQAWTVTPAFYVVVAWARASLLAYRMRGTQSELLILDGPGRVRAAGVGSLVAVSPDGSQAFVEETAARPRVRVLDVASGKTVAALDLAGTPLGLGRVFNDGDWQGSRIVAGSSRGPAIFEAGPGALRLARVIPIDAARFPYGVRELRFADVGRADVVGVACLPSAADGGLKPTVALRCGAGSGCQVGSRHAERSVHLLGNPSRPLIAWSPARHAGPGVPRIHRTRASSTSGLARRRPAARLFASRPAPS